MFRGKVVIIDLMPHECLMMRGTHDCILEWAIKHGCSEVGWTAHEQEHSEQTSIWDNIAESVYLNDCVVSPEEFDARGLLRIGPYYGRMISGNLIPDPEEETPASYVEAFKQFVNDFFNTANIAPSMQEEVWNMSLRHFCNIWTDTTQRAHQEKSISRRRLLTKPQDVICPRCGHKGVMAIVDGIVGCQFCGTIYGDIDGIPD